MSIKTFRILVDGEYECDVYAENEYQAKQQYLTELDIEAIEHK